MNNLNGNRKNEFRRKQEEKQRKLALKIKDEAGELREGSLKSEEAIPSLDELCAMGERVEQQTTFSAKEAIRNKIKARRDAERYKTTSTDSEKWTPNPFEDSNAAAIESPKNEDILNTTRKHADAQSTKSAGLKTSKRRSIVEMVQKLKKYVPIVVCGDVLYYYNGYYYEAIGLEKLIKLYRKYVDYDLNNEPSLYAYKDLYQCCTTDPELERSEPENQSIHAPLENGVYDLMKKELKPHDPRRLIFTYIKASYDESAEWRWLVLGFLLKKLRLLRLPGIREFVKMSGMTSRWPWVSAQRLELKTLCQLCRMCQNFRETFIIFYLFTLSRI